MLRFFVDMEDMRSFTSEFRSTLVVHGRPSAACRLKQPSCRVSTTGYAFEGVVFSARPCGAGNGKGVVKQMLERLLGPYFGIMQNDVIVTSAGQRPPSKGAATPHVSALKDKRITVGDETDEGQEIDKGSAKLISGGGTVSSRVPYGQLEEFEVTNLVIVMTNHPPVMRETNDDAMLRRLVYVNFPNLYVHQERFDPTNARHRPVDLELKQKMMETESLEQLLSHLVRGAVEWYARGGLGETPAAMQSSLNQYLASNDKLQKFIEDHCIVGEDLRAPMINFIKNYRDATSDREMTAEVLTRQMSDKGYRKKKRETEDEDGKRPQVFVGLRCDYVR